MAAGESGRGECVKWLRVCFWGRGERGEGEEGWKLWSLMEVVEAAGDEEVRGWLLVGRWMERGGDRG